MQLQEILKFKNKGYLCPFRKILLNFKKIVQQMPVLQKTTFVNLYPVKITKTKSFYF